jgi:hypothetical protein
MDLKPHATLLEKKRVTKYIEFDDRKATQRLTRVDIGTKIRENNLF